MMNRTADAYSIERELAARLRNAPESLRPQVAREVYADLYRLVPWHPDLNRTREERERVAGALLLAYEGMIAGATTVLEIGAGSCDFLRCVAPRYPATSFIAVDIVRDPLDSTGGRLPDNVRFVQAGAREIPVVSGSVDFAFCSQVLEHFHPGDVPAHLAEVARVLRPGGWFGCDTPNRVTGPHDVSRGFTREPTGLHLREWTYRELGAVLLEHEFDDVRARALPGWIVRAGRLPAPGPLWPVERKCVLEALVSTIPMRELRGLAGRLVGVDGIYVYARRRA